MTRCSLHRSAYVLSVHILFFLVTLAWSGCGRRNASRSGPPATYAIKGEVIGIEVPRNRIVISHGAVPGLMDAMTMPFKVRDPALLDLPQPGDSVEGVLAVSDSGSWLQELRVTFRPVSPEPFAPVNAAELFQVGSQLPNVTLTDQEGDRKTFANYRGKVVALTFIYTRCPIPDFCMRMSNHFSEVQRILKSDPLMRGRWKLVTISFDPERDTPAVLKQYAAAYRADHSDWEFLVGSPQTTAGLAKGFDMMLERGKSGLINHTLRTAILDRNGGLVRVIKGNAWTPEELAEEIRINTGK